MLDVVLELAKNFLLILITLPNQIVNLSPIWIDLLPFDYVFLLPKKRLTKFLFVSVWLAFFFLSVFFVEVFEIRAMIGYLLCIASLWSSDLGAFSLVSSLLHMIPYRPRQRISIVLVWLTFERFLISGMLLSLIVGAYNTVHDFPEVVEFIWFYQVVSLLVWSGLFPGSPDLLRLPTIRTMLFLFWRGSNILLWVMRIYMVWTTTWYILLGDPRRLRAIFLFPSLLSTPFICAYLFNEFFLLTLLELGVLLDPRRWKYWRE